MFRISSLYLSFSDAAKFADIARNLVSGNGFITTFNFWSGNIAPWISPLMPYSIAGFFKIFGINDFAVIATSLFYFILTLIFVFLLAKKVFKSNLTGVLSTLAVGFNYDLINYATTGASESPFIFEIVAGAYFFSLKKMWANIVAVLFLALMYLTRPHAVIYVLGLAVYFFFLNFRWKKASLFSIGTLIAGSALYILFSRQGASAITQNLPGLSASDSLRGAVESVGVLTIVKKFFYDIYNFYKLLPQIMNPYLFVLFVISLFSWGKEKLTNSFKGASAFMVLGTFLAAAITIPFFRYIHPIIPLVYIIAVGTLVEIISKFQDANYKQITIGKLQISKRFFLVLASCCLVLFFSVGQTLGIIFLDSRFEKQTHNAGKPHIYVVLSQKLKENTNPSQTIVTNLDTWGSWYGERKTVWFPLEPKQLIDPSTGKIPFDAIYLTSYLIDDQNYYMNSDWRLIFESPNDSTKWTCEGCAEVSREFKLKSVYSVPASDNYETQDSKAILLIKK